MNSTHIPNNSMFLTREIGLFRPMQLTIHSVLISKTLCSYRYVSKNKPDVMALEQHVSNLFLVNQDFKQKAL